MCKTPDYFNKNITIYLFDITKQYVYVTLIYISERVYQTHTVVVLLLIHFYATVIAQNRCFSVLLCYTGISLLNTITQRFIFEFATHVDELKLEGGTTIGSKQVYL